MVEAEGVKKKSSRDSGAREKILAAIRRAAEELGRAPSRGELRRITGVSHYKVLAEFTTLREAVRAAGLEPNPKGEKISTEALLEDWKRLAEKMGRRPSRAEYVREGRYSAGAFVARFGSWGKISTTEDTHNRRAGKSVHHGGTETRRKAKRGSREVTGKARIRGETKGSGERDIGGAGQWRGKVQLARVPGPVAGRRKVTELVAQLVVNTLLPEANSNWQLAIRQNQGCFTAEDAEERGGQRSGDLVIGRSGDLRSGSMGEPSPQLQNPGLSPRGIDKRRPVMGAPFDRSPMTNAPVNELGVVLLFGMLAAGLGFQVESAQGRFPDCEAKREVVPGKWQRQRIEFEYESKNFLLHGHDPKNCDVLVCWRHNWKDIPEEIEVIELCRLFGMS
ncbi:MAG TPA: hypothetical protein VGK24_03790 [Candidatus Angelobacter sp.]|jgi:hypothetical protein